MVPTSTLRDYWENPCFIFHIRIHPVFTSNVGNAVGLQSTQSEECGGVDMQWRHLVADWQICIKHVAPPAVIIITKSFLHCVQI